MLKKIVSIVLLTFMGLQACAPLTANHLPLGKSLVKEAEVVTNEEIFPNWPLDEEGRRIVPEKDLAPYPLELPPSMAVDLSNTLVLLQANDIPWTRFHCLVLITEGVYDSKYDTDSFQGTLSSFIQGTLKDYDSLLCYASDSHYEGMQSILIPKQGQATVVFGKEGDPYLTINGGELVLEQASGGLASPRDIDRVGIIDISFFPSWGDGDVMTPLKPKSWVFLTAYVEYPALYTTHYTPEQMIVDLP